MPAIRNPIAAEAHVLRVAHVESQMIYVIHVEPHVVYVIHVKPHILCVAQCRTTSPSRCSTSNYMFFILFEKCCLKSMIPVNLQVYAPARTPLLFASASSRGCDSHQYSQNADTQYRGLGDSGCSHRLHSIRYRGGRLRHTGLSPPAFFP